MRDSALEYELKLYNGASVRALIYLVYAEPLGKTGGRSTSAKSGTMGFNAEQRQGCRSRRVRVGCP